MAKYYLRPTDGNERSEEGRGKKPFFFPSCGNVSKQQPQQVVILGSWAPSQTMASASELAL